jgi:hypothetical protein
MERLVRSGVKLDIDVDKYLELSLREVILRDYKSARLRKQIFNHADLSVPIKEFLLRKEEKLRKLQELPGVGVGSVREIDYILQAVVEKILERSSKGEELGPSAKQLIKKLNEAEGLGTTKADLKSFNVGFSTGGMEDNTKHPFWLLSRTNGESVFYLPVTVPDLLKTKPVWLAEHGSTVVSPKYLNKIGFVFEVAKQLDINVEFVIDSSVLRRLRSREAEYSVLSEVQVDEQFSVFEKLHNDFPKRVKFSQVEFKKHDLVNCMVCKGSFVSSYVFGGYLVSEDKQISAHIFQTISQLERSPL